MCYNSNLIESTEVIDLEIMDDNNIVEKDTDIIAGHGGCKVQGCSCWGFNPMTHIPGGMGTCYCGHGIYDHA